MRKSFVIEIPRPCLENLHEMLPSEKGRFCNSCKKTVIDFTVMTDAQIINFYKNKNENVCGSFLPDQLNRVIEQPKKQKPWLRYFFTVTFPAFLFSLKSSGQNLINTGVFTESKTIKPKRVVKTVSANKILTGTVSDEHDEPLEGVSVIAGNDAEGTKTNQYGEFELKINAEDKVLLVNGEGFHPQNINIIGKKSIVVVLKRFEIITILAGEPDVYVSTKRAIKGKLRLKKPVK